MEEHPSEAQGQKLKKNQASEPSGSKDILNDEENPIDFSKAPGEDDGLIELTDEVDAALGSEHAPLELLDEVSDTQTDDKEVLELTDVFGEAREDDALLELADEVDAALGSEHAPLELLDEASETQIDDKEALELADVFGKAQEDNGLLELTDEVDAALGSQPVSELSSAKTIDEAFATTSEKDAMFTSNLSEDNVAAGDEPGWQASEDIIDSLGMEIETEPKAAEANLSGSGIASPAMSLQAASTAAPAVSQEQIQAAIEKVVREMLGEKIDKILTEVIQQAVAREISRLRTLLMDDTTRQDR